MKVPVINLSALAEDFRKKGLHAEFIYDADEEGYVLHVGDIVDAEKGVREISMAPGFTHTVAGEEERIIAYPNRVFSQQHDVSPTASASRPWIMANSFLHDYKQNKLEHVTITVTHN